MPPIVLDADVLAGLSAFIADRAVPPDGGLTETEAVNVVLRDWLMGQGYLALPGDGDRIVPALEAAEVPR